MWFSFVRSDLLQVGISKNIGDSFFCVVNNQAESLHGHLPIHVIQEFMIYGNGILFIFFQKEMEF